MKVFKYQVGIGWNMLDLPKGSKILSVGTQDGSLLVWALVTGKPTERRKFYTAMTGEALDAREFAGMEFVGTVHLARPERLVFHLFEVF